MYKLLPILLFAFLIAEEKYEWSYPDYYISQWSFFTDGSEAYNDLSRDSLDVLFVKKYLDEDTGIEEYGLMQKVSKIIKKENFNISIENKNILNFEKNPNKYEKYEVIDGRNFDFKLNDFMEWGYGKKRHTDNDEIIRSINFYVFDQPMNCSQNEPKAGCTGTTIGATFQRLININIDKSITLTASKKEAIRKIIDEQTRFKFSYDDLKFNSVDINKLNNNNQVSLNRDDIYDDSWAVIIGIDNYDNLSNLDYAVADAEAVKDMLIHKFDYPENNIKLLLNEEANKTNIVNVISDVSLKAGENDRILVFYAGHGETMPLPDGGEMGYLLPVDGRQENLYASAIPMNDLKDLSNMSKAKHMLFLVDACYGGLAAVGSRGLEPAKTPNYIEKITKIKSRQIITAGGKDEKVFEKSEWGHSAYTKNLLSALEDGYADSNGDGYITADELGDYLSEKVSIDSENQQTPQSRRLTSHEGELIFLID